MSDYPSIEQERQVRIEQIAHEDLVAWQNYIASEKFQPQNLAAIPSEAWRRIIPHRILELSLNPDNVAIRHSFTNLDSDPKGWESLRLAIGEKNVPESSVQGQMSRDTSDFDFEISNFTGSQLYLCAKFSVSSKNNRKIILVPEYIDNEAFQGQKVSKTFYDNAEAMAKDLGFKYMAGGNTANNFWFFEKRGRKLIKDADPGLRKEMLEGWWSWENPPEYGTYLEL